MDAANQRRRLLRTGVLFLLLTSLWGFLFPALRSPALGRSAHSLAGLVAVLLMAFGLAWPQLQLAPRASLWAEVLLVYSSAAIVLAFALGALWGAGSETMPIAAQGAHGAAWQEWTIKLVSYSSAPTGLAAFALAWWGLRAAPRARRSVSAA